MLQDLFDMRQSLGQMSQAHFRSNHQTVGPLADHTNEHVHLQSR